MDQPAKQGGNGPAAVLSTLARSADRWVQLATLALIGFSGFGNWLATQSTSKENLSGQDRIRDEMRQKLDEVHRWIKTDIHDEVDAFEGRQKNGLNKINDGLDKQNQLMANQQQMLKNQAVMLEALHRVEQERKNN
jgi:hypothetical protein